MSQNLDQLLALIGEAILAIDSSGVPYKSSKPPFREYQTGVGPYSETTLCKRIAQHLIDHHAAQFAGTKPQRSPDLLIPNFWAIELKIARPFGDNGKEAEHWSQNLLHPYPGNTSALSDAMKLQTWKGRETPVVVVVGYEHHKPQIALDPLIDSFEAIGRDVLKLPIGPRFSRRLDDLCHPCHQVARLWAWEIFRSTS